MSDAKQLVTAGIKAVSGEFRSKIQSKKFLAYIISNVILLVMMFTIKPSSEEVMGFLKLINAGYWLTEGGLDAIRATKSIFEKRNGTGNGKDV